MNQVTIISTLRRTNSLANSGSRSRCPSVDRNSNRMFCPSTYPRSRSPWRNSRQNCSGLILPMTNAPMVGIFDCACAASGQAAALPINAINSRRFSRSNCMSSPPDLGQDCMIATLPRPVSGYISRSGSVALHTCGLQGVKSRIRPERSHVSFRQLLRTYQRTRVQQLCAMRGPEQVQHLRGQNCAYSITSSARASSIGGTSRPSALAVLRLMASTYLFGACTGRSAGVSPFNMRLT